MQIGTNYYFLSCPTECLCPNPNFLKTAMLACQYCVIHVFSVHIRVAWVVLCDNLYQIQTERSNLRKKSDTPKIRNFTKQNGNYCKLYSISLSLSIWREFDNLKHIETFYSFFFVCIPFLLLLSPVSFYTFWIFLFPYVIPLVLSLYYSLPIIKNQIMLNVQTPNLS